MASDYFYRPAIALAYIGNLGTTFSYCDGVNKLEYERDQTSPLNNKMW